MQCDDTAQLCYRARQVIKSLSDDWADEKDELQKDKSDSFLTGLVCALQSVKASDSPEIARHIVNNYTSLEELRSYIKQHGNENDSDLIAWLDNEYADEVWV